MDYSEFFSRSWAIFGVKVHFPVFWARFLSVLAFRVAKLKSGEQLEELVDKNLILKIFIEANEGLTCWSRECRSNNVKATFCKMVTLTDEDGSERVPPLFHPFAAIVLKFWEVNHKLPSNPGKTLLLRIGTEYISNHLEWEPALRLPPSIASMFGVSPDCNELTDLDKWESHIIKRRSKPQIETRSPPVTSWLTDCEWPELRCTNSKSSVSVSSYQKELILRKFLKMYARRRQDDQSPLEFMEWLDGLAAGAHAVKADRLAWKDSTMPSWVPAKRKLSNLQEYDLVKNLEEEIELVERSYPRQLPPLVPAPHLQIQRNGDKGRESTDGFWFEVSDLVPNFVGRAQELLRLHQLITGHHTKTAADSSSTTTHFTSIVGLGGIGKSTLARKYASSYRQYFDGNVIWIDAGSTTSMRIAFKRCVERLGHKLDESVDTPALVRRVYSSFSRKKCLLIFDNVEEVECVKEFLPDETFLDKQPFLLLTSRRSDIGRKERTLQLGVLNLEDSVNFVQQAIPNVSREAAIELWAKLDCLPLALAHACAYIRNEFLSVNGSAVVNSYIQEFERNTLEMLKAGHLEAPGYAKTIAITWRLTLNKIRTMEPGPLAQRILQHLALMNPDHISMDFLLQFKFDTSFHRLGREFKDDQRVKDAIQILAKYSMISLEAQTVKVHRLVQEVVKPRRGAGAGEEQQIIKSLGIFIDILYDKGKHVDECLLHAQHLLTQVDNSNTAMRSSNVMKFLRYDLGRAKHIPLQVRIC